MRQSILFIAMLLAVLPAAGKMGGHGKVSMTGSIVASACNIATESVNQQIDLGNLPVNDIARDGHGPEKSFSIHLQDCEPVRAGAWNFKSLRMTFDGVHDDIAHLLKVEGDAKGVGLTIKDNLGQTLIPGEALPEQKILSGNQDLDYKLAIEKNNKPLVAGNYTAIVRFKVEYN